MNAENQAKGAGASPTGVSQRPPLQAWLWGLIGALAGALVFGIITHGREVQRRNQAQAQFAGLSERLLPKAEQQLAGIRQTQDDIENDLAVANAASSAREIKLGLYRTKLRRFKAQIEEAGRTMQQLHDEATRVQGRAESGSAIESLPADMRQQHDESGRQIEQFKTDLATLETRLDSVALYWGQLVARDAEAVKEAEIQKIREESAAAVRRADLEARQERLFDSTSLLLAGALQRSEAETERARTESLHEAALDALHRVQPAIQPVLPAVLPPVAYPVSSYCPPRSSYRHSYSSRHPYYPYYSYDPYRLRPFPYYRYSQTWVYGRPPPVMRQYGPYLLVGF